MEPSALGDVPLPRVTKMVFRNMDTVHPDNCCQQCDVPVSGKMVRVPLGVGIFGTGMNAMELQFTLSDQPTNVEYDIKRTKSKSTWERVRGKWKQLEFVPSGTPDDDTNDDECLIPKNKTIFSMDAPGYPFLLPHSDGLQLKLSGGTTTSVDATDIVMRFSFAECVVARDKKAGTPWKRISAYFPWHSVMWLTRNAAKEWVLDKKRSSIDQGGLEERLLKSAPST
jgi:hypothetical protein